MRTSLRVLLVEDSEDDALLVAQELRQSYELQVERVDTPAAMREALARQRWDIIITDYSMPGFSAPAALELLGEHQLDVPCIIVSGTIGEETAVEAMKAGAYDYLMKDRLTRLVPAVEHALRDAAARAAQREAEEALRRTEEALRHTQKMEALGRLAGGIVHDFNNLLTVILGYCEFLRDGVTLDSPIRTDIEEIRKAGERAAALTRQLLAVCRQQVQELQVLNPNEIVTGITQLLKRVIGEDIELDTRLVPDVGHVLADRGQMEQVLVNLVVNARDAMPEGGRLIIETANVGIDEARGSQPAGTEQGAHVMLAVSDTGHGMDAEVRARIFEPFFTTKAEGKGTGLGLSVVYGIIKQSGGDISVQSEPGKGTTLRIDLPRVDETPMLASQEPGLVVALDGTETILVVDDEAAVRDLARKALERRGYGVLMAATGQEALEVFRHHAAPIHLLITDVVLPDIDGRELADRIAALKPDTRIVYMSGYSSRAGIDRAVLRVGTAFLPKPFTPTALARKVREVLSTPPSR